MRLLATLAYASCMHTVPLVFVLARCFPTLVPALNAGTLIYLVCPDCDQIRPCAKNEVLLRRSKILNKKLCDRPMTNT